MYVILSCLKLLAQNPILVLVPKYFNERLRKLWGAEGDLILCVIFFKTTFTSKITFKIYNKLFKIYLQRVNALFCLS